MKIFDFSEKVGKHISVFQSNFIMSKIVNHQGNVHIGAMRLQENGIIGYHEAVVSSTASYCGRSRICMWGK